MRKIMTVIYILMFSLPILLPVNFSLYLFIGYTLCGYLGLSILFSRDIATYVREEGHQKNVIAFINIYLLPCLLYFNFLLYFWPIVLLYATTKFVQYHFIRTSFDLGSFIMYIESVHRASDFNKIFPIGSEIRLNSDHGEQIVKINNKAAVTGNSSCIVINDFIYSIEVDSNYIKGKTLDRLKYKFVPVIPVASVAPNIKKDLGIE